MFCLSSKSRAGRRDELPHARGARHRHRLRVEGALDERQQRQLGRHAALVELLDDVEQVAAAALGHALHVVGPGRVPAARGRAPGRCRGRASRSRGARAPTGRRGRRARRGRGALRGAADRPAPAPRPAARAPRPRPRRLGAAASSIGRGAASAGGDAAAAAGAAMTARRRGERSRDAAGEEGEAALRSTRTASRPGSGVSSSELAVPAADGVGMKVGHQNVLAQRQASSRSAASSAVPKAGAACQVHDGRRDYTVAPMAARPRGQLPPRTGSSAISTRPSPTCSASTRLQLGLPELDALRANRMPHRWLAVESPPLSADARPMPPPPIAEAAQPARCAVALHCRLRRAAVRRGEPRPRRPAACARARARSAPDAARGRARAACPRAAS